MVKAIVEAPRLDDPHIRLACKIVADAGADFAVDLRTPGTPITDRRRRTLRESLPDQSASPPPAVSDSRQTSSDDLRGRARVGTAHASTYSSKPEPPTAGRTHDHSEPSGHRVDDVRFDAQGLVPAVIQDARSGRVLTVAS